MTLEVHPKCYKPSVFFLQVNEDFSGTCYVNQEETRIKYSVSDYNELNNNENKFIIFIEFRWKKNNKKETYRRTLLILLSLIPVVLFQFEDQGFLGIL